MFKTLINNTIESVQAAKKIAVDSFVKHEPLANSFNQFVDAQTEYTKSAVSAMTDASTSFFKLIADKNFYEDLIKTAQDSVAALVPAKSTPKKDD